MVLFRSLPRITDAQFYLLAFVPLSFLPFRVFYPGICVFAVSSIRGAPYLPPWIILVSGLLCSWMSTIPPDPDEPTQLSRHGRGYGAVSARIMAILSSSTIILAFVLVSRWVGGLMKFLLPGSSVMSSSFASHSQLGFTERVYLTNLQCWWFFPWKLYRINISELDGAPDEDMSYVLESHLERYMLLEARLWIKFPNPSWLWGNALWWRGRNPLRWMEWRVRMRVAIVQLISQELDKFFDGPKWEGFNDDNCATDDLMFQALEERIQRLDSWKEELERLLGQAVTPDNDANPHAGPPSLSVDLNTATCDAHTASISSSLGVHNLVDSP